MTEKSVATPFSGKLSVVGFLKKFKLSINRLVETSYVHWRLLMSRFSIMTIGGVNKLTEDMRISKAT